MKRFVCHINSLLMRIGKPLAVTGIVFILVILMGTCGDDELSEANDTEYTDVEYSEDGSEVTVYLDGIGVPKSRSQRAITKDLAQAAFDFIEVVFVNGATTARTSWILGEQANIIGVPGKTGTAVNYAAIFPSAGGAAACMFVGREDSKVLLGVGKLTGTKGSTGTTVNTNTTSVTFTIAAIETGLTIADENAVAAGVAFDSFTFVTRSANDGGPGYVGGYNTRAATNTFRISLGGINYPAYLAPTTGTVYRVYTFSIDSGYKEGIRQVGGPSETTIQVRTPRYIDGTGYKEPKTSIDYRTQVNKRSGYAPTAGGEFDNTIELEIVGGGEVGILSFNIEVPVYNMISQTESVTWKVRTGVGSEFYSLDDGKSRGGCVLISVNSVRTNQSGLIEDFQNIEWTWFKGF